METKTRLETLISLRNDQLEKVLNREASMRLLNKMLKVDPHRVLVVTPDLEKLEPKPITVTMRAKEMREALDLDESRLMALDEMIEEERKTVSGGGASK